MKTRHVSHDFFLSNFAINSMKKKQRSQFCALEKLHFKGMFQQTLERREETRHGGKNIPEEKIPEVLEGKGSQWE